MLNGMSNHDILLIVYRYKWQSKINEVNVEYHKLFEWYDERDYLEQCDDPDCDCENLEGYMCLSTKGEYYFMNYFLGSAKYLDFMSFNHRDMNIMELDTYLSCEQDIIKRFIYGYGGYDKPFYIQSELPENYYYSSSKYLRTIHKSGVKCLL